MLHPTFSSSPVEQKAEQKSQTLKAWAVACRARSRDRGSGGTEDQVSRLGCGPWVVHFGNQKWMAQNDQNDIFLFEHDETWGYSSSFSQNICMFWKRLVRTLRTKFSKYSQVHPPNTPKKQTNGEVKKLRFAAKRHQNRIHLICRLNSSARSLRWERRAQRDFGWTYRAHPTYSATGSELSTKQLSHPFFVSTVFTPWKNGDLLKSLKIQNGLMCFLYVSIYDMFSISNKTTSWTRCPEPDEFGGFRPSWSQGANRCLVGCKAHHFFKTGWLKNFWTQNSWLLFFIFP